MSEMTMLRGQLSDIRYHAEDSGVSSVLVVSDEGHPVRAVGRIPTPVVGEILHLEGEFSPHATFGKVFAFTRHTSAPPADQAGQIEYLARLTEIPVPLSRTVMETFGFECFQIIENDPQRLLEIKEITPDIASRMHERWLAVRGIDKMSDLLTEFGLSKAQMAQLRATIGVGDGLSERLRENPYLLTLHLPTVSFRQADALASRLKADPSHPDRIASALLQILRHYSAQGHTRLEVEQALSDLPRLLGTHFPTKHPLVGEALRRLQSLEQVRLDGDHLYLTDIYTAENLLMAALERIERGDRHFDTLISDERLSRLLNEAMGVSVDTLIPGVAQVLHHKSSLIRGPYGADAQLLVRCIGHIFDRLKAQVVVIVPSLREKLWCQEAGLRVATAGEFVGRLADGTARFRHNQPTETDLAILCCAESFSVRDVTQVLDALPSSAGALLMGDPDALPPHGPGQPFSDLLVSERLAFWDLPVTERDSPRLRLTRSLRGHNEVVLPERIAEDSLIHLPLDVGLEEAVTMFYRDYLPSIGVAREQALIFAGIAPTERANLNQNIQRSLTGEKSKFLRGRKLMLHEGEPVFFHRPSLEHHIPSGTVGQVVAITPGPRCTILLPDGRTVIFDPSSLEMMSLGYVLPLVPSPRERVKVAMLLVPEHYPPPPRALLYTLGRNSERLILAGPVSHFREPSRSAPRQTRLLSLLQE